MPLRRDDDRGAAESEDQWFELSEDMWRDPYEVRRKLKLMADENVPRSIIDEIVHAGISIELAHEVHRRDDRDVAALARRRDRVLLTCDGDFWSDREHPIRTSPGVIVLRGSSQADLVAALGHVLAFASSFGPWSDAKVLATRSGFTLKARGQTGIAVYRIRARHGTLEAMQIASGLASEE